MEKERFISKLNIRDYNNKLECILSKKNFSEDIKNLLLSMLYKVENAYNDYSLVNGEPRSKREILEEILKIISEDCKDIEIIKEQKSSSIYEEGKIITYLNTNEMLYELYQIDRDKFRILKKYDIIKVSLEEILNHGYSISSNEIIRDFDGWSWNIAAKEIDNHTANLVYQTLKILVGNQFLKNWKENSSEDYILKLSEVLKNEYQEELAIKIVTVMFQMAIMDTVQYNQEERKKLIKIQERLQQDYQKLDNKDQFLENLKKQKKEISDKIKEIDNKMKNDREMKQEFIRRNENLNMNERIFSLSDLAQKLAEEKENLMKELSKCNKKMKPSNFVATREKLASQIAMLQEMALDREDKEIYNLKRTELINVCLEAMNQQIQKAEEKEDIIKIIRQIRYYSLIYVDEKTQVKDIVDINPIQKAIITKACKNKVITIFSLDIEENYEIIKKILQTNIIELKNMFFKFVKQEQIVLQIYDEKNIYKTCKLSNIKELNVKLNKKIKVFI